MTAPEDRKKVFTWRGKDDDERRLTELIADVCAAEIFDVNGSLTWFTEGRTIPITAPVLHEIISKHITGVRLTNRGKFGLAVEFFSFDFRPETNTRKGPNDQVLLRIIETCCRWWQKDPPNRSSYSAQREMEIRTRLKQMEPAVDVANYYGIPIDEVKRLGQH